MSTLILVVIFGLGFAFLATQNTGGVDLQLGSLSFFNVPLYLIAFGSLLIGLVLAWIINTVDWVASTVTIQDRESKIKNIAQDNTKLENRLHELEIENARLKTNKEVVTGEPRIATDYRPNLWDRLRANFSA